MNGISINALKGLTTQHISKEELGNNSYSFFHVSSIISFLSDEQYAPFYSKTCTKMLFYKLNFVLYLIASSGAAMLSADLVRYFDYITYIQHLASQGYYTVDTSEVFDIVIIRINGKQLEQNYFISFIFFDGIPYSLKRC